MNETEFIMMLGKVRAAAREWRDPLNVDALEQIGLRQLAIETSQAFDEIGNFMERINPEE